MESYVTLSFLNDFIFCPRSIYFHQLYSVYNEQFYKQKSQIAGTGAHATIDAKKYSTKSSILQGVEVFSEKYNIAGKIDVFDINSGRLTERKKQVKVIYDGYVFQVYAQYFALTEMGYTVNRITIHDLTQNVNYEIPLPEDDSAMLEKFEQVLNEIANYDLLTSSFTPNLLKCEKCIYSPLCDKSLC